MIHRRRARLVALVASGSALSIAVFLACSGDDGTSSGSLPNVDAAGGDRGQPDDDGGTGSDTGSEAASDAGIDAPKDANVRDGNGPGEAGAVCSFNYDCNLALRCECDESTGCACKTGARGTGKNGIDRCDGGNDCTSAVCVEGPGDGGEFYCSDECKTGSDCTGKLPLCTNIAFVGQICIRKPN